MALVKKTVRRKVTKVWDLEGNEHIMPILNAHDMVMHNKWTRSPPVIRYIEKDSVSGKTQVKQTQVKQAAPEPVEEEDEEIYEEDEELGEIEILNSGPEDGNVQVQFVDELVEVVPNLSLAGGKPPSTIDPSEWTKDQIITYAQDKFATKLSKARPQMELAAELSKMIENLGVPVA